MLSHFTFQIRSLLYLNYGEKVHMTNVSSTQKGRSFPSAWHYMGNEVTALFGTWTKRGLKSEKLGCLAGSVGGVCDS